MTRYFICAHCGEKRPWSEMRWLKNGVKKFSTKKCSRCLRLAGLKDKATKERDIVRIYEDGFYKVIELRPGAGF